MLFTASKEEYLITLGKEISGKKIREGIQCEISQHLDDAYDGYLAEGKPQEEAARLAIENTGDARTLGKQLNRVYSPAPKWYWLVALVVIFLTLDRSSVQNFIDAPSLYMGVFYFGVFWFIWAQVSKRKYHKPVTSRAIGNCMLLSGMATVVHGLILVASAIQQNPELMNQNFHLVYNVLMLGLFYALIANLVYSIVTSRIFVVNK